MEVNMKGTFALVLLVAGSALAIPAPARAESNSVKVSYADLNLASNLGREALQRRIAWAARTVCVIEDSKDLKLVMETRECRTGAVSRAQPAYEAALTRFMHPSVEVLESAALVVTNH
jgi:UrcA family protein